jgi:ATP-dependent Lhr-like helicase
VGEVLVRRGASFLIDLALATGSESQAVAAALWELIWEGTVTHDQWSVIRAGPPPSRTSAGEAERTGSGRPAWSRPGSRPAYRTPRPRFTGGPGARAGVHGGRYSWLPALRDSGATEEGGRGAGLREAADLAARQLLERYGIVARELLELEALPLPWGALYDALHVMELTGEVQRGYFVEGFSGAQFGLPKAVEALKALRERGAGSKPACVLLNACDPANLYGSAVRARGLEEMEKTVLRLPTNYLVLQDGTPALLLEAGARRLTPLLPLEGEALEAACAALRDLTEHPWPLRPVRQLRLERWGERPIRGSEAEAPLRAIGFAASPKGLEL